MYEGCSVCTCEEDEIPRAWLAPSADLDGDYGWISPASSTFGEGKDGLNDKLGRIDFSHALNGYEAISQTYDKAAEDNHGTTLYLVLL